MNPDQAINILQFKGYGNVEAPIWFMGLEEGLGGSRMSEDDLRHNLVARGQWQVIVGLQPAQLTLTENGGEAIDLNADPARTPVWDWQAKIVRGIRGNENWSDIAAARGYISGHLGALGGCTFLTEYSPIPARTNGEGRVWRVLFREIIGEPLDAYLQQRRDILSQNMNNGDEDRLIIFYGRRYWPWFRQLVPELGVAVPGLRENIELYIHGNRAFLFLPFLGNGQMSHDIAQDAINAVLQTELDVQ